MSMSSLGQQLASINGPGKNTGSILGTSRRHEDAIGRGLAHSVQVGHALYNKVHKYKASIIHEDARKASDVPLATIRENCVASLRHLETLDVEFGRFVGVLCTASIEERGLLTTAENDKIDKYIEDLLHRISLVIEYDRSKNNNLVSCLNVIEFLLRKYDIHIRPKTASTMILTMLPHHEEPYFLRLLQLIDLASLSEWAFLRPYAIPGARLGRSILAQKASKDVSLIRALCRLSQRNSNLPFSQQSLSFTAAVLVEALTLQTQRKGSMEERTCQAILPFVVIACRNEQYYKRIMNGTKHVDKYDGSVWQNWGYIMASTLVETGILASEPRSVLVTNVLHGLSLQQEAIATNTEKHGLKTPVEKRQENDDAIANISNGLVVSLTILAQPSTENSMIEKADSKESSFLPLISQSIATSPTSSYVERFCGFSVLDKGIYNALLRLEDHGTDSNSKSDAKDIKSKSIKNSSKSRVAASIANLYYQDGIVDSEKWVASILVFGWKRFVKYYKQFYEQANKKSEKTRVNRCKILNLVLNLVKHPHLEKLWKQREGQWVASFVSFLFLNTPIAVFIAMKNDVTETDDSRFSEEEYVNAILQTCRNLDGLAYEKGTAHALVETKKIEDRMALAQYLGLAKSKSIGDSVGGVSSEEKDAFASTSISLPPRVGLEHADSQIRLESIRALLEEAKVEEDRMNIDDSDIEPEGENALLALFRRFTIDDNEEVALAAAEALNEILDSSSNQVEDFIGQAELKEGALEALYKWAQSPADEDKLQEQLLTHSCRFASYAAKELRVSNEMGSTFIRLVEGLGSLLHHSNCTVSLEAAKGILAAFDQDIMSKRANDVTKQAKILLISDDSILREFQRVFLQRSTSDIRIRRQVSRIILDAISMTDSSAKMSKEILEYNLWLIESFGNEFDEAEIKSLGKSLTMISSNLEFEMDKMHSIFCRLSSTEGVVFDVAIAPYIHAICESFKDKQGSDVSPIAIVMETVLSSDSFDQIRNLLSIANEMISTDTIGIFYAIAPTIALCCHHDEKIRKISITFLSRISRIISNASDQKDWMVLNALCQNLVEKKSSLVLKGASFVSDSIATVLSNSKKATSIRKYILQAILCSTTAYGATDSVSSPDYFAKSWLGSCNIIGGYRTGEILLGVTESSGEAAFPILSRWESVGQPMLSAFLSSSLCTRDKVSYHHSQFIYAVVKMLRGATILTPSGIGISSTNTIISTGPSSHGRRARSYSFGKTDGIGVLKPYPADMQASIVSILTQTKGGLLHDEIRTYLFEIVLSSNSWREKVFSQMNAKIRRKIASAVLLAAAESSFRDVDSVLLSLPLDANDIAKLLGDLENSEAELSKLTFISDYINANHAKIVKSPETNNLFSSIFKVIGSFSEVTEANEPIEFARQALLSALLELIKSSSDLGSINSGLWTKKKTSDLWLNILQGIVIQKRNSSDNVLLLRSKRIVFLIFASLCEKYPKVIIPKLIPILNGLVSESLSQGEENTLTNCFDLVIPVYFKHTEADNLSRIELYRSFINNVCALNKETRPRFYKAFVHSLSMIPRNSGSETSPIGSFIAAVLARERLNPSDKASAEDSLSRLTALASQILSCISSDSRIETVSTIQKYAKEILFSILQEETTSASGILFPIQNLIEFATKGPKNIEPSHNQNHSGNFLSMQDNLCSLFVVVTCEVMTSHETRNIIRRADGASSATILRLWQDLLLIQSVCHNRLSGASNHDKSELLQRIVEITTQALDGIQNSLPTHVFLAFVTSLVTEGETQELRTRAVQLIAERSASSYIGKSEAVLFVDMIPHLLQLLVPSVSNKNQENNSEFLYQSVFAAIDSIGRNTCLLPESTDEDRKLDIFTDAAFKVADVLEREVKSIEETSFLSIPSGTRQLVSSAALCSSTAIKICGPRALPVLSKLVKPLLKFLVAACDFITSSMSESNRIDKKEQNQAKLMQLSILRTFGSIVQCMPMLLKPYLVDMFSSFQKVYGSFRGEALGTSQPIKMEMVALQKVITSHIPARQLVPAASKAIFSAANVGTNLPTVSIMIESVTNSKSSEVSGMISSIIRTVTHIYSQETTQGDESAVMEVADELMLCLVMKLSEVQLRSLYRKLREWRGDVDASNPEESGKRRSAFWRFSSTLSKQLKSIYLSCLTTVFSDAVDELEMASLYLSNTHSIKRSDGTKKQKISINGDNSKFETSSLIALKNLLLCLETSLRSDAHEGGAWIRESESQRYDKLLGPLGKLLYCRLPHASSTFTFETVVQGKEEQSGSVVECVVALATAAGDEQLWKPLNHSILQACSDENRLEVRKAGISCLLSMIKSIGEEYMVLIPECLPVLSELLEDPDEEIAGMAQECISHSEELLGESLQDSLL